MFLREIRRRTQRLIWPIIGVGVIMYFSFHLVSGSRGFLAWRNLTNHIDMRQAHLNDLIDQEQYYLHRVNLLKGKTASTDLITERAKQTLGLARSDEIVVIHERT